MLLTEGLKREKIFDILWLHSLKSMAKILDELLTPPYDCTFSGTVNSSSIFTSYKGFMAHAKGSGLKAVPKETEQNL